MYAFLFCCYVFFVVGCLLSSLFIVLFFDLFCCSRLWYGHFVVKPLKDRRSGVGKGKGKALTSFAKGKERWGDLYRTRTERGGPYNQRGRFQRRRCIKKRRVSNGSNWGLADEKRSCTSRNRKNKSQASCQVRLSQTRCGNTRNKEKQGSSETWKKCSPDAQYSKVEGEEGWGPASLGRSQGMRRKRTQGRVLSTG